MFKSNLRVLEGSVNTVESEVTGIPSAHDIVTFLASIYHANQFKVEYSDRTNISLIFDVPSFEIQLLDEFSKRRIDRRLYEFNVIILKLPKELNLLTKIDVSAVIHDNSMSIRFHLSGKFMTINFEINTTVAYHMSKFLSEIHDSYRSSSLCLISSNSIYANDYDLIRKQISSNRVYNIITCSNEIVAKDVMNTFDKDLTLIPGVTCY